MPRSRKLSSIGTSDKPTYNGEIGRNAFSKTYVSKAMNERFTFSVDDQTGALHLRPKPSHVRPKKSPVQPQKSAARKVK